MSLASLIRRCLVLLLAISIPFALTGLALGWVRGLVMGVVLGLLLILVAALRAESGLLKAYRVRTEAPAGASRSLERVMECAELTGKQPKIFSFSDPAPQALVVRSPGSVGSILVSEGLLGVLTEDELRHLLLSCVTRLRARGIRFQSLCAWMAHIALEFAPRPWIELLFGELRWHEELGALGALRFVLAYSVARFFVRLGRVFENDAAQGFAHILPVSGEVFNPGSCILHFNDPWATRSLFPL